MTRFRDRLRSRLARASGARRRPTNEDWIAALESGFRAKLPEADAVSVSGLRRVSSWHNSTWRFTAHWFQNGREHVSPLVLRCPPSDGRVVLHHDVGCQYEIVRSLNRTEIPVPECLWMEHDANAVGVPFFVMSEVEGIVCDDGPPDGVHGQGLFFDASPEQRSELWWRSIDVIADLHSIDWRSRDLRCMELPGTSGEAIDDQIAKIEGWLRWAGRDSEPVLRAGVDWAKANRPEGNRLSLCWGDPKIGNLVYHDHDVAAMLDWELAHIGPPEGDVLHWLLVDEFNAELCGRERLEGMPDLEATVRYYENRVGTSVENFAFHHVFQSLRLAALVATLERSTRGLSFATDLPSDWWRDNVGYRNVATHVGG